MFLTAALAGFISGAGLIIAIGAQNAFVLRQGLLCCHVTLVVSIAVASDILLIMCGVAGIGALVKEWSILMQTLRFGGAVFLGIYGVMAAWRACNSHGGMIVERTECNVHWHHALLACLCFTFLNPHVYLDTMVLLGSLSTHYPGSAQWAFGIGACLASVVWFSALGYGARFLQPVFSDARAWTVMDSMIAVLMMTLCVLMLVKPVF